MKRIFLALLLCLSGSCADNGDFPPPFHLRRNKGEHADAIRLALRWLSDRQEVNGSWNCSKHNPHHLIMAIPYYSGKEDLLLDPAVTGLALLAFAGDGHTHRHGEFNKNVRAAVQWLRTLQNHEGRFALPSDMIERHWDTNPDGHPPHGRLNQAIRYYNHVLPTLALMEIYGMTGDSDLLPPIRKAIDFVGKAYATHDFVFGKGIVDLDIDLVVFTVSIFNLASNLHLRERSAGETKEIEALLDYLTDGEDGSIHYFCVSGGADTTAMAVYCRQLLPQTDEGKRLVDKGCAFIIAHPPVWRPYDRQHIDDNITREMIKSREMTFMNYYYCYYGAMALLRHGGEEGERWRRDMTTALLKFQVSEGDEKGCWEPVDLWSRVGGRVYSTALSALILEAPKRFPRD